MMNRRDFLKILGLFALSPKKIYAQKSKTKGQSLLGLELSVAPLLMSYQSAELK